MPLADTAKLIVALTLDDKFSGPLRNANSQLRGFGGGLSQMNRGVGQVAGGFARLGERAALAAAGGLTAVITIAASYEQAWAGVEKTTGLAGDASERLRDEFEQLARTIPLTFEELAAIGEAGGALGIATADLAEFTDTVARLSFSTNLSSEEAATALGQLGNILHLSSEDLHDFADSLVALGNAGASTEAEIVEIAARFGAAGKAAGLSADAILGLSSAAASLGVQPEAAGQSLSRLFNSVATNIGTANDKARAFADGLGLSLAEFRTAWDHDANGVFLELLGHIDTLDQFEAAAFLEGLGIINTRDVNTIRLMADNVGLVTEQLGIAANQTDELNRESQKFIETTEGMWGTFKNNVGLAADALGSQLLPVVNEVLGDLSEWLSDPAIQKGLGDFGRDLAEGFREFFAEVRSTDWAGFFSTVRGAVDIAKGAFDVFNALPADVKALILAAAGINRLSGGALTSIAGGMANILGGALKVALAGAFSGSLGGALANILGTRGFTPATPMYVWMVNQVPGAGGPGTGTAPATGRGAGTGTAIGNVIKWVVGPAAAAALGAEIGVALTESQIAPAREFQQSRFEDLMASDDPLRLQRAAEGLEAIAGSLENPMGWAALQGSDINAFFTGQDSIRDAINNEHAAIVARLRELGVNVENIDALATAFGGKLVTPLAKLGTLANQNLDRGTKAREGGTARAPVAVLPDTAMAPVTNAIGNLAPIIELGGAATKAAITTGSAGIMNRVDTLSSKFDPSNLPRGTKEREGGTPAQTSGAVMLPDTALAPVTAGLAKVKSSVDVIPMSLAQGAAKTTATFVSEQAKTKATFAVESSKVKSAVDSTKGIFSKEEAQTRSVIQSSAVMQMAMAAAMQAQETGILFGISGKLSVIAANSRPTHPVTVTVHNIIPIKVSASTIIRETTVYTDAKTGVGSGSGGNRLI